LPRFAAADAEGPMIVEQHHEGGLGEGLGEPCDAVFLTVVDQESDFASGRPRDRLIARSLVGPTATA
jgi:hypothetical protein